MSTPTTTATGARPPAGRPSAQGTSARGAWRVVAQRELLVKLRDKVFVGSFVVLLVLSVAGVVAGAVLGGRTSTTELAVVAGDDRAAAVATTTGALLGPDEELRVVEVPDEAAAEAAVAAGDVDAALLPAATGEGLELVGDEEVGGALSSLVPVAAERDALERGAAAAGTTPEALLAGADVTERLLDPSEADPVATTLAPLVFGFLFYLVAIQFGMAIAQSVVEEKQSRVVEILAAVVPLRALLLGKVVANGALALAQVAVLAGVVLVGLAVTGNGALLAAVGAPVLWFVLFFVLGFVALACVWAVAGSVATRTEDLQATTTPLLVALLAAFYAGIFGSGWVLVVASYVPIASTVAMPTRLVAGEAAWWEPLLSAGLVLLAAVVLVRVGARLYERSLLRTDRRSSVRELLREQG
ncbi:ABC transporter permease [Pseudokineococcus lusitanus]|uniref:ABC-2 type transport system permease protein n=1 Tax=Pseudokineococcus lusitanus TaxID=763993 RepID=A0A3N1HMM3_9ACTN|nr:ABC transporter permease [Pseudokineococcus lusitanus]ROP43754.1 ABC-2 type transport system permease protein [Pseudokineococcus lusitanus]